VQTIVESVKKTGRVVIVSEGYRIGGVPSEVAMVIIEEAFDYLDAPIKRVTTPDVPIPMSPPLEEWAIPSPPKVIQAVKEIL